MVDIWKVEKYLDNCERYKLIRLHEYKYKLLALILGEGVDIKQFILGKDRMLLLGGCDVKRGMCFKDTYVLDLYGVNVII